MKLRATFLFFLLLKASIVTSAVIDKNIVVNVGGVTISARTPTGFYKTSDTYPTYFDFVEKYATGKETKLLSWLVPEKDYLRLKNNQKPNSGRYINLKINKALIGEYFTAKDFDELKVLARKEQYTATNDLSSDINKEFNRISRDAESDYNLPYKLNLKMGETSPLGLFIDKTNAIGFTEIMQIKGKFDSGSELTKVASNSLVLVRGKLIFVYVYSAYNTHKDVLWAEEKAKEMVDLILNIGKLPPLSNIIPTPAETIPTEITQSKISKIKPKINKEGKLTDICCAFGVELGKKLDPKLIIKEVYGDGSKSARNKNKRPTYDNLKAIFSPNKYYQKRIPTSSAINTIISPRRYYLSEDKNSFAYTFIPKNSYKGFQLYRVHLIDEDSLIYRIDAYGKYKNCDNEKDILVDIILNKYAINEDDISTYDGLFGEFNASINNNKRTIHISCTFGGVLMLSYTDSELASLKDNIHKKKIKPPLRDSSGL